MGASLLALAKSVLQSAMRTPKRQGKLPVLELGLFRSGSLQSWQKHQTIRQVSVYILVRILEVTTLKT